MVDNSYRTLISDKPVFQSFLGYEPKSSNCVDSSF